VAVPTVTNLQIAQALRTLINGQYASCSSVEILTEFPSDPTKVRAGIYVNDVTTIDRSPYSLAVRYGGNIYIASDSFEILYVSFQGDRLKDTVVAAIQDLVYDNVLFDGYHERDYATTDTFENRAEIKTVTFTLKRLDFQ
jgi:hypothetical protein